MRKVRKIALFLIMFLSFMNVTKAARNCADALYARSGFDSGTGVNFTYTPYGGSTNTINYHLYNLVDNDGVVNFTTPVSLSKLALILVHPSPAKWYT